MVASRRYILDTKSWRGAGAIPEASPVFSSSDIPHAEAGNAQLETLLHAGFVLTGIVNTMLGPMLPVLSARWELSDARAGYLFTAQFSGSMLGVMASSVLMTRRGHRTSLILGLLFMATGSAGLLATRWTSGLLATLCFGAGLGLAIPTTNLLVSELNPKRRAAALSLINFSWGAGAAVCPFLVAAMLRMHRSAHMLYGIAALLVIVALSATMISFPDILSEKDAATFDLGLMRSPWVPILGALFFLYVGSEAGVGGWIATYAQRLSGSSMWVFMPSFFWIALLTGRASAPLVLRVVEEARLAQLGLTISIIGLISVLVATTLPVVAFGISLAGLGFSSIFPIAIAALSRKFGPNASRIAGFMFALAGAGGATIPWLIGWISATSGTLKIGLFLPVAGSALMLILNLILARPERIRSQV